MACEVAISTARGSAAVAVVSGGKPNIAYAGWTPALQPTDASTLAETADACGATPEHGPLRLIDHRGEIAVGSFADGRICVVVEGRLAGVFGNVTDQPPADTAAVDVDQVHRLDVVDAPTLEITAVTGSVDERVDTVTIERADGVEVEAAVANGAFLAWWPEAQPPVTVQAFAAGEVQGTWTADSH